MAKRKLNRYFISAYLEERDASGNYKRRKTAQNSASSTAALKHALHYYELAGVKDIQSIKVTGEPIPVSDLKTQKPPMHKERAYCAVYDGMDLRCYEHLETGARISAEEYRNL